MMRTVSGSIRKIWDLLELLILMLVPDLVPEGEDGEQKITIEEIEA